MVTEIEWRVKFFFQADSACLKKEFKSDDTSFKKI